MRHWAAFGLAASLAFGLVGCGGSSGANNTNTSTGGNTAQQASGATQTTPSGKAIKVGLVSDVAGIDDKSFNQSAAEGVRRAAKELGVQQQIVVSQRPEDYVNNLSNLAQAGYDLVIAVGFNMEDAAKQVAQQYPKTHFLIIDSSIGDIPNLAAATFKAEQAGYLVGALAGLVEKEKALPNMNDQNVVGVVGGQEIPPVDDYIAGFQQGIQKTDPGAKVLVRYAGKFDDPTTGNQLGELEISQGADILFPVAGNTGNGAIQAAQSHKLYAIGVDSDQSYVAPGTVITSALKRVDVAVYDTVKAVQQGNFKGGVQTFDLTNDGVGMAPVMQGVPQKDVDQVNQLKQQIISGQIQISTTVQK